MAQNLAKTDDSEKYNAYREIEGALTREQMLKALPPALRNRLNPEVMEEINRALEDPDYAAVFREHILGYTGVLQSGKFSLTDYISAVKYVSYKLMGHSNQAAWCMTFPERHRRLLKKDPPPDDLSPWVSAYSRGKLVNQIMEQTLIPTHVLNQDIYQQAVNTQAELMLNAKSEKVRSDAANSLLQHLRQPDVSKVEVDVNVKEGSVIDELRRATQQLAKQQKAVLEAGTVSPKDIAESTLVRHIHDDGVSVVDGELVDERAEVDENPE